MGRVILLPAVNNPETQDALEWAISNIYKLGDTMHILAIVPYAQAAYSGVMLPPSVEDVDQKLKMTEGSLKHRLGSMCDQLQVPYTLEVVKAAGDAESIGEFICSRAVELDATLVVMGAHEKGAAVRFFVGSVTSHCVKHCARPVVVHHGSERTVARVPSLALMASSPADG